MHAWSRSNRALTHWWRRASWSLQARRGCTIASRRRRASAVARHLSHRWILHRDDGTNRLKDETCRLNSAIELQEATPDRASAPRSRGQDAAQRLHHQLMIGALRKPRDGHAAHNPRAFHGERKRSAMRGELARWQSASFERVVLHLHREPNPIGAAMEPRHHIALALHPRNIVRGGSFQRRIKQRLPEAPHVDPRSAGRALRPSSANERQVPRPSARPCASVAIRVPATATRSRSSLNPMRLDLLESVSRFLISDP
jgi:hypothetical protein